MTDREALLRAIIENPEDDAPRLVYADWLDEHGDPDRAEFIRLTVGPGAAGPLGARAEELLARNGERWRSEAPVLPGVRWGHDLRRGFVHEALLNSWVSFVPAREALFAAVPLDNLAIGGVTTGACRLIASEPRLRRLRVLILSGNFNDAGAVAVAGSPHVCNLHTLYLSGVRGHGVPHAISDKGGRALLDSPHLGRLRRLYAAGYPFSNKLKEALRDRFPDAVV